MKQIIFLSFLVLILSCSPQKKLLNSYIGKPVETMESQYGKAVTVFDKKEGKVYIFEKTKYLKGTEISQGKLTLDPIVTPQVEKKERYYVTVKNGVIASVKQENEYERR